ncbi:MAG: ABC transporter permease subunit [Candidatus Limnocylindrales bacterium]
MSFSRRRVGAVVRKELQEYRHNRSVVLGMGVLPLVFIIQPLVAVIQLGASASGALAHEHVLVYMLGIPALVPVVLAAYAVAGERQQGTLEPALSTPIQAQEFLLGKALAALLPSVVIAYGVFALFIVLVTILAPPSVTAAFVQGPDVLAQIVFTPLLATWSIWLGIGVSTRASDVRVAQQAGILASLPGVFVVVLVAVGVIPASLALAVGGAVLLVILDVLGWRVASRLFDRERLISGAH